MRNTRAVLPSSRTAVIYDRTAVIYDSDLALVCFFFFSPYGIVKKENYDWAMAILYVLYLNHTYDFFRFDMTHTHMSHTRVYEFLEAFFNAR